MSAERHAAELIPCCQHCWSECDQDGRRGHDDTCALGCNDDASLGMGHSPDCALRRRREGTPLVCTCSRPPSRSDFLMGWAVGGPDDYGRWYGYGVPATCDHPECSEDINRGLSYACGDGVMGRDDNCGLHFCGKHLAYYRNEDPDNYLAYCERCANGRLPFEPKPETAEWLTHLLTDDSWQRDESPAEVERITGDLHAMETTP